MLFLDTQELLRNKNLLYKYGSCLMLLFKYMEHIDSYELQNIQLPSLFSVSNASTKALSPRMLIIGVKRYTDLQLKINKKHTKLTISGPSPSPGSTGTSPETLGRSPVLPELGHFLPIKELPKLANCLGLLYLCLGHTRAKKPDLYNQIWVLFV